jgi:hypothetical protein
VAVSDAKIIRSTVDTVPGTKPPPNQASVELPDAAKDSLATVRSPFEH